MGAPVSIIIPAFNQLEYCRQCVHSLLARTTPPYKLILVDNGSTDGVGEFFDSIAEACVIHAGTNRGFAGGVNLGLAQAEGHAVLLNSDTILPEGWLERLVAPLARADVGLVGPVSNCVSGIQQVDAPGLSSLEDIDAFARTVGEAKAGATVATERLVGFCLLIRDEALRKIGLFDESFGPGNFEDDDYCLRARRAGYRLVIARDCFVFHYGSRTFIGMDLVGDRWQDLMARNRERFLSKWAAPHVVTEEDRARAFELGRKAREAIEDGHTATALRMLRDAIAKDPTSPDHFNDLGVLLWQVGERERALEQFRRALRLAPDFEEARRNLKEGETAIGS